MAKKLSHISDEEFNSMFAPLPNEEPDAFIESPNIEVSQNDTLGAQDTIRSDQDTIQPEQEGSQPELDTTRVEQSDTQFDLSAEFKIPEKFEQFRKQNDDALTRRVNAVRTSERFNLYSPLVDRHTKMYGIDSSLMKGLITQESQFNPHATSHAGASGITQFMPATARAVAAQMGMMELAQQSNKEIKNTLKNNPNLAIEMSAFHFKDLVDRFDGDIPKALAAYNAGEGRVKSAVERLGDNWLSGLREETQAYVPEVLKSAQLYGGNFSLGTSSSQDQKASTSARNLKKISHISDEEFESFFKTKEEIATPFSLPAKIKDEITDIANAYKQGNKSIASDWIAYQASLGNASKEEMLKAQEEFEKFVEENPVDSESFPEKVITGLSQYIPQLISSTKNAVAMGLAGASAGGLAGGIAGTPAAGIGAVPGAAAGAAAGASVGAATGTAMFFQNIAQGASYRQMVQEDIKSDIAAPISMIVGVGTAIPEVAQLKIAAPVIKKAAQKATQTIMQSSAKFGVDLASEVGIEGLQGAIEQAGTEFAKVIDDEVDIDPNAVQNIGSSFVTQAVESIPTMFGILGAGRGVGVGVRQLTNRRGTQQTGTEATLTEEATPEQAAPTKYGQFGSLQGVIDFVTEEDGSIEPESLEAAMLILSPEERAVVMKELSTQPPLLLEGPETQETVQEETQQLAAPETETPSIPDAREFNVGDNVQLEEGEFTIDEITPTGRIVLSQPTSAQVVADIQAGSGVARGVTQGETITGSRLQVFESMDELRSAVETQTDPQVEAPVTDLTIPERGYSGIVEPSARVISAARSVVNNAIDMQGLENIEFQGMNPSIAVNSQLQNDFSVELKDNVTGANITIPLKELNINTIRDRLQEKRAQMQARFDREGAAQAQEPAQSVQETVEPTPTPPVETEATETVDEAAPPLEPETPQEAQEGPVEPVDVSPPTQTTPEVEETVEAPQRPLEQRITLETLVTAKRAGDDVYNNILSKLDLKKPTGKTRKATADLLALSDEEMLEDLRSKKRATEITLEDIPLLREVIPEVGYNNISRTAIGVLEKQGVVESKQRQQQETIKRNKILKEVDDDGTVIYNPKKHSELVKAGLLELVELPTRGKGRPQRMVLLTDRGEDLYQVGGTITDAGSNRQTLENRGIDATDDIGVEDQAFDEIQFDNEIDVRTDDDGDGFTLDSDHGETLTAKRTPSSKITDVPLAVKQIKNLLRTVGPDQVSRVKILVGNRVNDANGRELFNGDNAFGGINYSADGTAFIFLSNELDNGNLLETTIHEIIGHYKFDKIVNSNPALRKKALRLFLRDRDSRFTRNLERAYKNDLERSDNPEGLLFQEWVANTVGSIGRFIFDEEGNLKPIEDQKRTGILYDFLELMKEFFASLFQKDVSQQEKEAFVRSVVEDMSTHDIYNTELGAYHTDIRFSKKPLNSASRALERLVRQESIQRAKSSKEAKELFIEFAISHLEKSDLRKNFLKTVKNIEKVGDANWRHAIKVVENIVDNRDKRKLIRRIDKLVSSNYLRLPPEQQEAIDNILSGFDVKKMQQRTKEALEKLSNELLNPALLEGERKVIAQKVQRLDKVPLATLSVGELQNIVRDIERATNVLKTENTNKFFVRNGRRQTREEVVQVLKDKVKNFRTQKLPRKNDKAFDIDVSATNIGGRIAKTIKSFGKTSYNGLLNAETIANEIDGWEENGAVSNYIYNDINEGTTKEFQYTNIDAPNFFQERLKDVDITKFSPFFRGETETTVVRLGGKNVKLNSGQIVSLYLHTLNPHNLNHIVKGHIIVDGNVIHPTVEELRDMVDNMSDDELQVANTVYDFFNVFQRERGNEASRNFVGYEEFNEDDYFPIKVDSDVYDALEENISSGSTDWLGQYVRATIPGRSITTERQQGATQGIELEDVFEAVGRTTSLVGKYIGLAQPVHNLIRVTNIIKSELKKSGNQEVAKELENYVQRIAGLNRRQAGETFVRKLMSNFVIGSLGLNMFTSLKQSASLPAAMTQMPVRDVVISIAKDVNIPKAMAQYVEEVKEHSPQLFERISGGIDRDVGEAIKSGRGRELFKPRKGTLSSILNRNYASRIMAPITLVDTYVISRIWEAAKVAANEKGFNRGTPEYWEFVRNEAEKTVGRSQPTFNEKDRSRFGSSKNILLRGLGFNLFFSQLNKDFMMIHRAMGKLSVGKKKQAMKDLGILLVVQPAIIASVNELRRQMTWDEERLEDESSWERFLQDYIFANIARLPIISQVASEIWRKIRHGRGFRIEAPVMSVINSGVDFAASVAEQDPEKIKKAAEELAPAFGIPARNVNSYFKMLEKNLED